MMHHNPPAFPTGNQQEWGPDAGMSLRDWFAGQALIGIVSNSLGKMTDPEPSFAFGAYRIADAMLAEREGQS